MLGWSGSSTNGLWFQALLALMAGLAVYPAVLRLASVLSQAESEEGKGKGGKRQGGNGKNKDESVWAAPTGGSIVTVVSADHGSAGRGTHEYGHHPCRPRQADDAPRRQNSSPEFDELETLLSRFRARLRYLAHRCWFSVGGGQGADPRVQEVLEALRRSASTDRWILRT